MWGQAPILAAVAGVAGMRVGARACCRKEGRGGGHHEQHVSRPDQDLGRGHALLLSARHAAQHGVAHHRVRAPGQPQQLDDQLHPAAAPSNYDMKPVSCPDGAALV